MNIQKLIFDTIVKDDINEFNRLINTEEAQKIIKSKPDVEYTYYLKVASINSSINIIKLLLLSPELKQYTSINCDNDYVFRSACGFGRFDIINFILETPELNRSADEVTTLKNAILEASMHNQLEVFKYFLNKYDPKIIPRLNSYYEKCFIEAFERESEDMVPYFIFELEIPKSKRLHQYIEKNNAQLLKKLFEKREFKEKLDLELNGNFTNSKKLKI